MIIDAFTFFNELDLLELRLNVLDSVVDRFVLVEADRTFQNEIKPLYFQENKQRFEKFLHKIDHVIVNDMPGGTDPWLREAHQRNAICIGLKECNPDDVILISDVDEIPNPDKVISASFAPGLRMFRQALYYYYYNYECDQQSDLPWTAMVNYSELTSPQEIRDEVMRISTKIVGGGGSNFDGITLIANGGWHFSYMGGVDAIIKKIRSFSHQEYNNDEILASENINAAINHGRDIFNRNLTFTCVPVNKNFPEYLINNIDRYKDNLWECSVDPEGKTAESRVAQFVGYNKDVLLIGNDCSPLSKALIQHFNCTVLNVDFSNDHFYRGQAQQANYFEDKTRESIENSFGPSKKFDTIVVDDIFKALVNPNDWLASLKRYLKDHGEIVVSVTNDAHNGILASMLCDNMEIVNAHYMHSRQSNFYTAFNINCLFSDVGFEVKEFVGIEFDPLKSKYHRYWIKLPVWLREFLNSRHGGNFTEYVMKANLKTNLLSVTDLGGFTPEFLSEKFEAGDYMESLIEDKNKMSGEIDRLKNVIDQLTIQYKKIRMTRSWRVTRPLRILARIFRYGILSEDCSQLSQSLRSFYRRVPLPPVVRKAIRAAQFRIWHNYKAIKKSFRSHEPFNTPTISIDLQSEFHDYFIWGVIGWDFRQQRPQQISKALKKFGRRVFYISPNFVEDERSGFEVVPLDNSSSLFEIKLYLKRSCVIYFKAPSLEAISQLRKSLGELLLWTKSKKSISVVQHPFWYQVASVVPNSCLIYDCMDHHNGFGNYCESLIESENQLLTRADLTITTSTWLDEEISRFTPRREIIRNATDYNHFSQKPQSVYRDPMGRKIVGYYGAIAEWFDLELVSKLASQLPDCLFLLIGDDTVNAKKYFSKNPNIKLIGEVNYINLPEYLYGFDVCLLPFKILPLTLATNPVKVYEYLSAGKPIVSIDIPEMSQFGNLVSIAKSDTEFFQLVNNAVNSDQIESVISARKDFASGQTWEDRTKKFIGACETLSLEQRVSVIVVTYNNLALTKDCLNSLVKYCDYDNTEIIVVDNASSDETPRFLKCWAEGGKNRKIILNCDNKGFAAANNQGLRMATGDYLVLLNNDTYVTPGWLKTFINHLNTDPTIGIIGPVTNNIGNEARINVRYEDFDQMILNSSEFTIRHLGQLMELRTVAFFCVMFHRDTYLAVGELDEDFGRGFFEDDDYCRRIEQRGLRVVCAQDVFVHHHLSASFNQLKNEDRIKLFNENKEKYEKKWGKWIPHTYRV